MFEKYLIEKFVPWSLKIDFKNTISLITKEKEKYFLDTYNHFAYSFKDLPIFELHMFRVSVSKINLLNSDLISINLPDNNYNSIYILHDSNNYNYFYHKKDSFELIDALSNKVVGVLSNDNSNLNTIITTYMFSK